MNLEKSVFDTQVGQLFKGDCLDILPKIESESIDCVFADPPFNLNKDYGTNVNDKLPENDYLNWCYKWIDECVRILKKGGSFYLYNLPKWNIHLAKYMAESLNFKHWITVNSTFSLPVSGRLYPAHYSLLYFTKGKKPNVFNPPRVPIDLCRHCYKEIKDYGGHKNKLNPRGLNISDVWNDIPVVRHKKYKNRAANELSLKMLDRILDISTKKGDVILDPFGGSGTTYVAAEVKERKWIGIELSTTQAIIDRFKYLEFERDHIKKLETEKNTLFTEESLIKREKRGLSNLKYFHTHSQELVCQNKLF